MSGDKRREDRIGCIIEISVSLRDVTTLQLLAGPMPARINNIGLHGVGISLNQIRFEKYHFFYSVLDSAELEIVMEFFSPETDDEKIIIPLRPVWFDRDLASPMWPFVMGFEFLSGYKDEQVQVLRKLICNSRNDADKQCHSIISRIKKIFD